MLTLIANSKTDSFAPWEITKDAITKGKISLPIKGLSVKPQELKQDTSGLMSTVSEEKLFLDFDRVNLSPSLTASTTDKSYHVALVTETLPEGEKVVYVRSEKGYLLEWNYNVLSNQFDAILAFRASHMETSVSIFVANAKGEVRELKYFRSPDKEKVGFKADGFKVRPEIRTDKKLSILPYRPYKPTKHIIAHRSQMAKAKESLGETNGYEFHEYLNLKTARVLVSMLKKQGVTAITIFYNEDNLTSLTDDQRFFSRVVAEYFEFVNISYKGVSLNRYYFNGKTTLPSRKQAGRKPNKSIASKKPADRAKSAPKGKKPFAKKDDHKKPNGFQKVQKSSTYGARGNRPQKHTNSRNTGK